MLYNNDAREIIDMLDKKNMIVVTDPPFNIGYHYHKYSDKMNEDEYWNMVIKACGGGNLPMIIIHYPEKIHELSIHINKAPTRIVSWVYNSNTGRQHRDVAFYGIKPDFNQVRQPYKNLNDKRIQQRINDGKTGAKLYDWWNINQVKNVSKQKTNHPCQMPMDVMKNIVGLLPKDAVIFDGFMGSGTTGVAVEEMNRQQDAQRRFIGCEIDEQYFNIAKTRIKRSEDGEDE